SVDFPFLLLCQETIKSCLCYDPLSNPCQVQIDYRTTTRPIPAKIHRHADRIPRPSPISENNSREFSLKVKIEELVVNHPIDFFKYFCHCFSAERAISRVGIKA